MNGSRMAFFLGRLAQGLAVTSLVPLLFALAAGEPSGPFFLMTGFTILLAAVIFFAGARQADVLTLREGIAVTGIAWMLASVIGSVPYVTGGWLGWLDAFLESTSGFTGAGATVFPSIETLPKSILLWRSLTHWIGGLGIVVFFIALLPQFGEGAARVFETESGGAMASRVLPRMTEMAKTLFVIYIVFSLAAAISYWLAGMTIFDAANHAMSTIATGGFSTHDESAAYFRSPAVEWCMILFMLLASVDFSVYIAALRYGIRALFSHGEMRFFFAVTIGCALLMAAELSGSGMDAGEATRTALFHAATVSSTTGFVAADFDAWPPFSRMCLLMLMAIGGCAGSTAGGIKAIRVLLILKLIAVAGRQVLSPQSRPEAFLDGKRVRGEDLIRAGYFLFAYCFLCLLWALIFVWDGTEIFDALALAVTTMGNVGPGFGAWGATEPYAALPALSKLAVCASMLIGRLEIFPMLALLRPGFWNRERGWD